MAVRYIKYQVHTSDKGTSGKVILILTSMMCSCLSSCSSLISLRVVKFAPSVYLPSFMAIFLIATTRPVAF